VFEIYFFFLGLKGLRLPFQHPLPMIPWPPFLSLQFDSVESLCSSSGPVPLRLLAHFCALSSPTSPIPPTPPQCLFPYLIQGFFCRDVRFLPRTSLSISHLRVVITHCPRRSPKRMSFPSSRRLFLRLLTAPSETMRKFPFDCNAQDGFPLNESAVSRLSSLGFFLVAPQLSRTLLSDRTLLLAPCLIFQTT